MNLNQVTFPSKDLSISVPFYKNLGLRLIVDALPKYARFECPVGDASFSLHQVDVPTISPGFYVYFEVDDLDQTFQELVKKGISFEQKPENTSWLWREARLKDPDGNLIVLYHAGENRLNPPWRIKK